jgi:2,4-diaminopentanoate dehydrogenase
MIRVLVYGLGPIGSAVAQQVAGRAGFRLVGGVDIDPAKAGRDVGEIAGLGRRLRLKVTPDGPLALQQTKPDIVALCTGSSIQAVVPQIEAILKAKVAVVATTEELVYPVRRHLPLARKIDAMAKRARVAVLGTGVNPGFAMDALPIVLTAACGRIDSIVVKRVQDARQRRLAFQTKIGGGLTRAQFERQVAEGSVGHVGLPESIAMIADAMGWRLDRVTQVVKPTIATETVASEFLAVDPGYVCGLIQEGVGYRGGQALIRLYLEASLGAADPCDSVVIEGVPRIAMTIPGGLNGDVATASIVVNSMPKVLAAAPGLRTMRDLPIPSFYGGR